MVLLTLFSQGAHLLSVGSLIVVGDQAYHRCVISKFDDVVNALPHASWVIVVEMFFNFVCICSFG